ncbi:MAG: hypothetical protein II367_04645 [Treponema sp.]|nr:hypothetical protein [Treponema sp.]
MILTDAKAAILLISFVFMGIVFFAAGLYFTSKTFLDSLKKSHETEEDGKRAVKSGKICGYVAMGTGGFTAFCGIITKIMPQIFSCLALVYVLALIAAFTVISRQFPQGNCTTSQK